MRFDPETGQIVDDWNDQEYQDPSTIRNPPPQNNDPSLWKLEQDTTPSAGLPGDTSAADPFTLPGATATDPFTSTYKAPAEGPSPYDIAHTNVAGTENISSTNTGPLIDAFKKLTGRDASGAEVQHYLDNPNGWYGSIAESPEALAYAKSQVGKTGSTTPTKTGGKTSLDDILSYLKSNSGGGSDLSKQLAAALSALMGKYAQPVDANDPNIKAAQQAYHGTAARGLADYQEKMAERAHAEGVPTGAFDAAVGNATATSGMNEANLSSQLVERETNNRRSALDSILGRTGSMVSSDNANALGHNELDLRAILGSMGLSNQEKGIDNQNSQFYDSLARLLAGDTNNLDAELADLLHNR